MATKSGQQEPEKAEVIEELLDALDTSLDRVKVLYEQYFLGIQKQPPTYLHTDIERKIRDLAQLQIRNTALRYRYATLGQKFGSYNSYWRRTLRQIEQGTYTRNLSKIGRQSARTGADVPEEILAAMPKRMREQVKRDREAALANARRREKPVSDGSELLTLGDEDVEIDVDEFEPAAFVSESTDLRRNMLTAGGAHRIAEDDEFDVDAFFARVTSEGEPDPLPVGGPAHAPPAPAATAAKTTPPRARTRPGSSGHPRPRTISGSPTAVIPRSDRLPPAGSPLEAPAPPPVAGKRPSGDQANARLPVVTSRDAPAVELEAARTSPIAVRPTPPPVPARATQALPRLPRQPLPGMQPTAATAPTNPPVALAGAPSQRAVPSSPPAPGPGEAAAVTTPSKPTVAAPTVSKPGVPATMPAKLAAVSPLPIKPPSLAPSQMTRPLAVTPGAAAARPSVPVETMSGPFPRIPSLPAVPPPPRASAPSLDKAAPVAVAPPIAAAAPAAAAPRVPTPPPRSGTQMVPRVDRLPAPPLPRTPAPERVAAAQPMPSTRTAAGQAPLAADVVAGSRQPPERPTPPSPARTPRPPSERPVPEPRQAPPPGMSDADVNALYAKYVQAKQILGEEAGPGAYGKLLKTINAQAPKIMEQYNSKGVDFSVVVKDNQVVIRAKPKP